MKKKFLSMVLASGLALTGLFGNVASVYADTSANGNKYYDLETKKDGIEYIEFDSKYGYGNKSYEKIYYDSSSDKIHIIIDKEKFRNDLSPGSYMINLNAKYSKDSSNEDYLDVIISPEGRGVEYKFETISIRANWGIHPGGKPDYDLIKTSEVTFKF